MGMILVIKWFKNCSYQNMMLAKNVLLNYIIFFIEKIQKDLNEIHFKNQMLTLFDN